jgi:hypothetical protein
MTGAYTVEGLSAARTEVERVCGLLVSPSTDFLDACPGLLERACSVVAEFRLSMHKARGNPEALAEAYRLQTAVGKAASLLESALDYQTQWNRILGAMTGGYTPAGDAAPVIRRGRVWLTG